MEPQGDPGEEIAEALAGSWLKPYFFMVEDLCSDLFKTFGTWTNKAGFEAIGNLHEEMVEDRVMTIHRESNGRYGVYVHHDQANA